MPHQLPDLPYAYDALEPFLNEETMHLDHDKHHAGYVKGLNEAEEKIKAAQQSGDFSAIRALCDALAFNYSGHLLHSLFWNNMSPDGGGEPAGKLAVQINRDFGSFATFKAQFLATTNSVQGSGWGVLALPLSSIATIFDCAAPFTPGEPIVDVVTQTLQAMEQRGAFKRKMDDCCTCMERLGL